jgi:hypothetical protein
VDKIWSAEELAALSPAEQDALFQASVVRDLDAVPQAFLAKIRAQVEERIAERDSRRAS